MAALSGRVALLLLLCTGPTPRGTSAWGVALDGLVYERGRKHVVLPALQLSWRRGVGEDWDWGLRVYAAGLEAGTRHRLLSRGRLTLAALPSLELAYVPVTNNTVELLHARLRGALLADWRLAPRWTMTLGARLAFGGAAPPTWFRGYSDGAVLLAQPEALGSLAVALAPGVQLRLEAGVGVPLQLGGSARPALGSGGLSLSWTRD
jgi:hypothetical protein